MSGREIGSRLMSAARVRLDRLTHSRGRPSQQSATMSQSLLREAARIVPGASVEECLRLRDQYPRLHRRIEAAVGKRSESILSGHWQMLGFTFDLDTEINWHRDPRTNHQFPRTFYFDVPLHQDADNDIDVKYVWELGRQQYLVELARGWLLTGDQNSAALARRIVLSWIEENPVYEGVHWSSGLEVAVRAVSWIWTLATLAEWEGWTDEDLVRISGSLIDHATYLEHHFSFYSSPYNHLIGEATGLYLISLVLRRLPESARWLSRSRDVLEVHGPRQFYSDGFCVEQAMGYHFFTVGFLSMAIAAARQEGTPLVAVERATHQAFRAGDFFRRPDGLWPAIGDVDSARAIPVHPDEFWNFDSVCSLGAVLFEDPELKRRRVPAGEELYWLLGCQGVEQFEHLRATGENRFTHLQESGYVIARQNDDWLCFDVGPIAHGLHADGTPSTAHGHLDTMQVLYSCEGLAVLVDPGMPFYFGDREWVGHFRGSAAHNTVQIEGLELAREAGRLEWARVAGPPSAVECREEAGAWLAHACVTFSRSPLESENRWERHALLLPGDGLYVLDWFDFSRPLYVTRSWMLDNRLRVQECDRGFRIAGSSDTSVRFQSRYQKCTFVDEVHQAERSDSLAWTSGGYGQITPATSILQSGVVAGQAWAITYIGSADITALPSVVRIEATSGNHETSSADTIQWRSGNIGWRFEVKNSEASVCQSDAPMGIVS